VDQVTPDLVGGPPKTPQASSSVSPGTRLHHRLEAIAFLAAMLLSLIFMCRAMAPAFGPATVVHDDARLHLFWMQRYRDPELFRDDLIASYYASVAPPGTQALYWLMSRVMGISTASLVLPFVLGLISAVFTYLAVRRLHRSPLAAFAATALVSRYNWEYSSLASATPRAFMLPFLMAFLWALLANRRWTAVAIIGGTALFYPSGAVLGLGVLGLRLLHLQSGRPVLPARREIATLSVAVGLVLAILLPGQLLQSGFGPVPTAAQARAMREYGEDGHNEFFAGDWYTYWIESDASGFDLGVGGVISRNVPLLYEFAILALPLPLLLLLRRHLHAARRVSGRTLILVQLLLASLILFGLAHLLFFNLYFPSRYVKWSVPVVVSIAAGLVLAVLVEEAARRIRPTRRQVVAWGLVGAFGLLLALYPGRFRAKLLPDPNPELTEYLQQQPKDILIAATPSEADFIPSLAGRSVLASREHALAFHLGFYNQIRQRLLDQIAAYYAESPTELVEFVERYGIDLLVVNRFAYDRREYAKAWGGNFEPYTSMIPPLLEGRHRFVLPDLARRCHSFDREAVMVVPASCVRAGPS
jgi:hypothetical protein